MPFLKNASNDSETTQSKSLFYIYHFTFLSIIQPEPVWLHWSYNLTLANRLHKGYRSLCEATIISKESSHPAPSL